MFFGAVLLLLSSCSKQPVPPGFFSEKMPFSALTGLATSDHLNRFDMEPRGDKWMGVANFPHDSTLLLNLPDTLVPAIFDVLKNTRMVDTLTTTRPDSIWIQGPRGITLELKYGYESRYWVIGKESFRHGQPVTYVRRAFEGAQPCMMAEGHLRKRFNLQICDYFEHTPVRLEPNLLGSFTSVIPGWGAVTYTRNECDWNFQEDNPVPPPMPFSRNIGTFISEDPLPMRGVALKPEGEIINDAFRLLPALNLCKEMDARDTRCDFLAMIDLHGYEQVNSLILSIYKPKNPETGPFLLQSSRYPGRYFMPTDAHAVEQILEYFRTITARHGHKITKPCG